jgi:hypothetical protein
MFKIEVEIDKQKNAYTLGVALDITEKCIAIGFLCYSIVFTFVGKKKNYGI